MDQVNTSAWIGRTISDQGGLDAMGAAKLHATIGHADTRAPTTADPLPPLWHWSAFPPLDHVDDLGTDGHPGRSDLLPPLRLPRRMWAGGALRFHAPLRIGDPLTRQVSLRSIVEKETATGLMAIVTLDHAISGPQGLAIEERQDLVYLPMPTRFIPPMERRMPCATTERITMSQPLLMRYSASTFNAHRIHYDVDYARSVEKYPDLLVHGPLQASLLMRHAIAQKGRVPAYFDFRAVHPMFVHSDLDICTTQEDGIMSLFSGQDGHQGMQATAIWEDTV